MPRAELAKCFNRFFGLNPDEHDVYQDNLNSRIRLWNPCFSSEEESQRLGLSITCVKCGAASSAGPVCSSCRALTLTCALCRLSCRGLASLCPSCGHGGHPDHLRQWFHNHDVCPIGCGCPCPSLMTWLVREIFIEFLWECFTGERHCIQLFWNSFLGGTNASCQLGATVFLQNIF